MAIIPWLPGATYTSKGMIFTVLSIDRQPRAGADELVARCLVLDDHPKYTRRIPLGTIMELESWTSMWEEALQITSLEDDGRCPHER